MRAVAVWSELWVVGVEVCWGGLAYGTVGGLGRWVWCALCLGLGAVCVIVRCVRCDSLVFLVLRLLFLSPFSSRCASGVVRFELSAVRPLLPLRGGRPVSTQYESLAVRHGFLGRFLSSRPWCHREQAHARSRRDQK